MQTLRHLRTAGLALTGKQDISAPGASGYRYRFRVMNVGLSGEDHHG